MHLSNLRTQLLRKLLSRLLLFKSMVAKSTSRKRSQWQEVHDDQTTGRTIVHIGQTGMIVAKQLEAAGHTMNGTPEGAQVKTHGNGTEAEEDVGLALLARGIPHQTMEVPQVTVRDALKAKEHPGVTAAIHLLQLQLREAG